jgi:hypothetical protein
MSASYPLFWPALDLFTPSFDPFFLSFVLGAHDLRFEWQVTRERFKADEDVSKVTSEVSSHLSQIARSRDAAQETAKDLTLQLRESEEALELLRSNATSEIERLRAEVARLSMLLAGQTKASQEGDSLRAELREVSTANADLMTRLQVTRLIPRCRQPWARPPSRFASAVSSARPPAR